jgi:hypothetical protein
MPIIFSLKAFARKYLYHLLSARSIIRPKVVSVHLDRPNLSDKTYLHSQSTLHHLLFLSSRYIFPSSSYSLSLSAQTTADCVFHIFRSSKDIRALSNRNLYLFLHGPQYQPHVFLSRTAIERKYREFPVLANTPLVRGWSPAQLGMVPL